MTYEMDGIKVNCAEGISKEEAAIYLKDQLQVRPHETLLSLDLSLKGDNVVVKPHYDTIVRVRRITAISVHCRALTTPKRLKLPTAYAICTDINKLPPCRTGVEAFLFYRVIV